MLWVSQVVLKPTQARTRTQEKHLANMMLSTHWSLHPGMLLRQLWQKFLSSTELRWLCSLLCCPEVSSVPLRNYCWRYRHLCLLHLRRYTRYGSIHWQCVYLRWQCYCSSGNFTWYGTMLPSTPFSNVFVTSVTRSFHIVSHCFTLSLEWVSACKMLKYSHIPAIIGVSLSVQQVQSENLVKFIWRIIILFQIQFQAFSKFVFQPHPIASCSAVCTLYISRLCYCF